MDNDDNNENMKRSDGDHHKTCLVKQNNINKYHKVKIIQTYNVATLQKMYNTN